MRDQIIAGLDALAELERLYRKQKTEFRQHFASVYGAYRDRPIVEFWNERLNYKAPGITWGSKKVLNDCPAHFCAVDLVFDVFKMLKLTKSR